MDNPDEKQDETKIIYLTPKDAADYLKVSIDTVYRWMKQEPNPLPSYRTSYKTIRIRMDELDKWVETYLKTQEKLDQE